MSSAAPSDARVTITVPELAMTLGVGATAAWKLVNTGEIKSFRIGRRVLIPRTEIARLLARAEQTDHA
ncbi:MAG: helix-turn-helix domain-containing protein [Candidatus Eremiobacteraeota bacterium]|nr:helix-turn-helix domain-containing protein [Candidatus Eremiobacteraeota bacterium]MBC5826119.1 helix-turn-helix domain-containing protein [Candidatus Eremiobacteraeota bacterium]